MGNKLSSLNKRKNKSKIKLVKPNESRANPLTPQSSPARLDTSSNYVNKSLSHAQSNPNSNPTPVLMSLSYSQPLIRMNTWSSNLNSLPEEAKLDKSSAVFFSFVSLLT